MKKFKIRVLKGKYAVCKITKTQYIPAWALQGKFFSLTKTDEEISFVCEERRVRENIDVIAEKGWKIIKIDEILEFSVTGIIKRISEKLSSEGISIFVVSTYDTDYILVKEENLDRAVSLIE